MDIVELKAEKRDKTGKGVAKKLRAAGRVPAVLYGNADQSTAIAVDARELAGLTRGEAGSHLVIRLLIGGDKDKPTALIKEAQYDPIKGGFMHIDFQRVIMDQSIATSLPITSVGDAPGIKLGGVLEHHLWDVEVEGTPTDMPTHIEADVSNLQVGESFYVKDLTIPAGIALVTDPEEVVLSIFTPRVEAPTGEEAEEAAEVIKTEEAAGE